MTTIVALTDLTSWAQRFALIQAASLSDEQVQKAFDVGQDEIDTARTLLTRGDITIDTEFDAGPYTDALAGLAQTATKRIRGKTVKTTEEKAPRVSKILEAFKNLPTEPTPLDEFLTSNPVSQYVLRQAARFDTTGLGGRIRIRKTKDSGDTVMIWRDLNSSATESANGADTDPSDG